MHPNDRSYHYLLHIYDVASLICWFKLHTEGWFHKKF